MGRSDSGEEGKEEGKEGGGKGKNRKSHFARDLKTYPVIIICGPYLDPDSKKPS